MNSSGAVGRPWYQNFWPWFIVVLLGVSVVGSLATVYVAFLYGDEEIERRPIAGRRVDEGSVDRLTEGD